MVSGHVETLDPAVLIRVPHQLVVAPELLHPQVGGHYLVLQVLESFVHYYLQFVVTPHFESMVNFPYKDCDDVSQLLAGISNFKGNEVKLHVKIWINLKF